MSEYDRTIRYLFLLSLLLIALAYYAGANKLLGTTFQGVNTLGLTFTGRNDKGQFAAYPSGAPAS